MKKSRHRQFLLAIVLFSFFLVALLAIENSVSAVPAEDAPVRIMVKAPLGKSAQELAEQLPEQVAPQPKGLLRRLFVRKASAENVKVKRVLSSVGMVEMEITASAAEQLAEQGYRIEEEKIVHALLTDSVPLINATQVWALKDASGDNVTGKGITIAILDTGINYSHPDLGGCNTTDHLAGNCKVIPGYDYVNNDTDAMDDHLYGSKCCGHGTHCAGIAAANGTLKGVAPDATLVAYKVMNETGYGSSLDIIAAIDNATDEGYDVISLSIGGSGDADDLMSQAVDAAVNAGVVVVVAAGNDGPGSSTINSPGTARLAITVGNTNDNDGLVSSSSRGPNPSTYEIKPELTAPGSGIVSTSINGPNVSKSGTSMSCPHVAGAAALLKQFRPEWSPVEIKAALVGTAKDLGLSVTDQGAGRLRVLDAVNASFVSLPSQLSLGVQSLPLTNVTAEFNLSELSNATYNISLTASLRTGSTTIELNASTVELSQLGNGSVRFVINLTGTEPSIYSGLITANSSETNISIPFWLETEDTVPPAWSGNVTSIPATYSPTTSSIFNITWTDGATVSHVLFESNFSGSAVNYTMDNITASVYNFSSVLPAGSHYWKSYANDTSNNKNQTGSWPFSIAKATPTLNLTLNGTEGAVTIDEDLSIWLNGSVIAGDGGATLSLFIDGASRGAGTIISNLTTFSTPGTYNISLNYTTTQNYTASTVSYLVTVNDITPPGFEAALNVTPNSFDASATLNFTINWTDNFNLTTVWFEVNRSGTLALYTATNATAGLTNASTAWNLTLSDFPAGTHYWRSNATDSQGNVNTTDWYAFNISKIAPTIVLNLSNADGSWEGDISIDEDGSLWLNCSVTTGAGDSDYTISLWKDGDLIGTNTSGMIANLTGFATPGTYNISLNYTSTQNYSYRVSSYILTVNDTTPPAYSAELNVTPGMFDTSAQLNFTVNWTDWNLTGLSVFITVNRSNTLTTYAASNHTGPLTWNLSLSEFPAGTHYWRTNATDVYGNLNDSSPWFAFTIDKIAPTLNLTLNGTEGDVAVDEDTAIWLNGSIVTGDGGATLTLYLDTIQQNSGTSVANLTTFATPGTFNISLNYTTTQNYTAMMISYLLTVGDITPPSVTNLMPIAATHYFTNTSITISADIADNVDVSVVWANITWQNGSELLNLSLGTSPTYSGELGNRSETGIYNVTFFANDTINNLNSTEMTWFNVTEVPDTTAPAWANADSYPPSPANYSASTTQRFNVTWTDAYALDTVLIEHNFTGTLTNYSVTSSDGSIYYYDYGPIAVGTYVWKMYANDSSGNANTTTQYSYTITKATPVLNLTLNGTAGNVTIGQASSIWLNASVVTGDGSAVLSLFLDGVLQYNGISIANLTNFSTLGTFNISLNYTATQNFTAGMSSYIVTVVDVTAPTVLSHTPTGTVTSSSTTLTATTDENATCRYCTSSGTAYENMTNLMTGNTTTHTDELSGLTNGVKHYYIRCNNSAALVSTTDYDASFTVSIPSSGGGGSGGSIGVATASDTETSTTKVITSVSEEKGLDLHISKESIPVNKIEVEVTDSATKVEITVSATEERPESVDDPLLIDDSPEPEPEVVSVSTAAEPRRTYKQVYKYLEIKHKNLEGKIEQATLEFKVTKAWLTDNNYDRSSVVLLRHIGSSWEELKTSICKETAINVYYTATTPGFSVFAIAVKEKEDVQPGVAPEEAPVEPPEELPVEPPIEPPVEPPVESHPKPPKKNIFQSAFFTIAVATILASTGLGYIYRNRMVIGAKIHDSLKRLEKAREERLKGKLK